MSAPIYLDNHATTRMDPRALELMLPYFLERYGNSSSKSHRFGWAAEEAVENARAQVAALFGVSPKEILFTSGATESDNLAIKGVCAARRERGNHIVVSAIEHHAVLDPARKLEKAGAALTVIPVGTNGIVDPAEVERALRPETVLVSIMTANNEIGTIQPIAEIAALCRARGVVFHSDAAQAAGRIPLNLTTLGVDLASFSAHKMYGPKGVGALYLRKQTPRLRIEPQTEGGGQEQGLRPGTLPVPLIVGFGAAAAIAHAELQEESARILALRNRLLERLRAELEEVHINGDLERRLPGNLNLSFAGVEGEGLIVGLKDIALSAGSACSSGAIEPSYVLSAIGLEAGLAHSALRFGIGRFTTTEEIDRVAIELVRVVRRLRQISPLWETRVAARGLSS